MTYWADIRADVCKLELNRAFVKYLCDEWDESDLEDNIVEQICRHTEDRIIHLMGFSKQFVLTELILEAFSSVKRNEHQ